jgi:hypothetical protein
VNLLPAGVVQERGTKKKHVSLTCDGSACLETDQCARVGGCVVEEEEEDEGRITSVLRLTEEGSAIQIQNPNQLGEPDRRMRKIPFRREAATHGAGSRTGRPADIVFRPLISETGPHMGPAFGLIGRVTAATCTETWTRLPVWARQPWGDGNRGATATVGRRQDQHCWELGWSLRAPPEHKTSPACWVRTPGCGMPFRGRRDGERQRGPEKGAGWTVRGSLKHSGYPE